MSVRRHRFEQAARSRRASRRAAVFALVALLLVLACGPGSRWAVADDVATDAGETAVAGDLALAVPPDEFGGTPVAEEIVQPAEEIVEPTPEASPDEAGAEAAASPAAAPVAMEPVDEATAPGVTPATDEPDTLDGGFQTAEELPEVVTDPPSDEMLPGDPVVDSDGTGGPVEEVAAPSDGTGGAGDVGIASVDGTTSISPNNAQSVPAGSTAVYTHIVEHVRPGTSNDVKNITTWSLHGWAVTLFKADGVTPLPDTNGDGIPDSGKVTRGKSATIVVKVAVPAGVAGGVVDIVSVFATSVDRPWETAVASDVTTVLPTLTLTIDTGSVSYGQFSPAGNVDPLAVGVTSQVDGAGATYVASNAVTVTVVSSSAWSGSCQAQENTGTAATITIADGRLAWRFAGGTAWTPFTVASPSPPLGNGCLPNPALGANSYVYDYALRTNWTDQPGTFNSVVVYVAQS
jgi:hypothetical protein